MADTSTYPALGRSTRYASLDIWRGIACLMVVIIHASFYVKYDPPTGPGFLNHAARGLDQIISRLGIGVPMFFVISGYCIAATADVSRRKKTPSAEYFRRRIKRIFPPFWAALSVTILMSLALGALECGHWFRSVGGVDTGNIPPPDSLSLWQWIGNSTLTEEWRYHLAGDAGNKILGPSWTLCYEEQFYVVCGLTLLFAARHFFKGILLVTAATVGISIAGQIFHWPIKGFFFDGRWLMFAMGVFVYQHLNYAKEQRSRLIPIAMPLALLALIVVRYFALRNIGTKDQKDLLFELIVAAAFACVILSTHRFDNRLFSNHLLQPLAFCGKICYSLYLIHWPVSKLLSAALYDAGVRGAWPTFLVAIPVCIAASVAASWGFYLLVERHFLNSAPRPAKADTRVRAEVSVPGAIDTGIVSKLEG